MQRPGGAPDGPGKLAAERPGGWELIIFNVVKGGGSAFSLYAAFVVPFAGAGWRPCGAESWNL